jgi:hypothetical protein
MADSLRAVRKQAPATNTTQDFTVSGFGTPTAAVVFSHVSGEDSDTAPQAVCMGFWDGTNNVLVCKGTEDGETPDNEEWTQVRNDMIIHFGGMDNFTRTATIANTTDGVTLTWAGGDTTDRPWTTVILISCIAAHAGEQRMNQTDGASVSPTTTGVDPNFIFLGMQGATSVNSNAGSRYSWGFASDDSGGIKNYCLNTREDNAASPTTYGININTSNSVVTNNYTAALVQGDVTAFGTGSFTLRTNGGAVPTVGHRFIHLACEFTDVPEMFTASTPTSDVLWDPYTDTQKRQSYLFITSPMSALDTYSNSGNQVCSRGYYFVNEEGDEFGYCHSQEDNVTTKNASGRHSADPPTNNDGMIIQSNVAGAPLFSAKTPNFNDTGLEFPAANVDSDSTARYMIGVGFGTGATGVDTNILVPTGPVR